MPEVSLVRLYLLRTMYLLIAAGLGIFPWPLIVSTPGTAADSNTGVMALLGALSLLCVRGIRYPLPMVPLPIFELAWKTIWLVAFALPLWLAGTLDACGHETLLGLGQTIR
ncbi:MAG: hypothetical protein ABI538_11780 [Pseudoxanthomonas sp.]